MKFPLWQYLSQFFLYQNQTAIVNPTKYQQLQEAQYLEQCLNHNFLKHCWNCDYHQFIEQNWYSVDRHYLEENNHARRECQYCWQLDYYRFILSQQSRSPQTKID